MHEGQALRRHEARGIQEAQQRQIALRHHGLHALHALPRVHVDLAVFVDAPRDLRWARAAARERAGDRPWPLEYLEHFFHTVAEPTYARHADAYRASAHFVVVNDGAVSGDSA